MSQGKEYKLVEKPALENFKALGYETYNAVEPKESSESPDNRESLKTVILENKLRKAIKRINPWINENNLNRAVNKIKKVKATDTMHANKKIHNMLVEHISLEQNLGKGKKNQTVKYIDYDNIENNDFLVLNQFKVSGPGENIQPDLVVFVNGLPLGVIECKSPTITDAKNEAYDQMMRYQNKRGGRKEGAERLFEYNQFCAVSWNEGAESSAYGAPPAAYKPWKDTYPASEETLQNLFNKDNITPQDELIYALFKKERLLDMLQHFTVFENTSHGLNKMVARYQQYRAVRKAMEEVNKRGQSDQNGGVVWHTQGSGKSLTMLFLGLKLRRERDNPTLVILTDRVALDDQIRDTFQQCGFPNPVQADGVSDLQEKLTSASGQTITTLIQKFQEKDEDGEFPTVEDEEVYVLADEAHRTQYGLLANTMRSTLPNAFYIGFSGTPIEKEEKSSKRTFGRYIDTYTIDQSIEDGTTLEIFHQGRKPNLHLEHSDLDEVFDRVFSDRTEEERQEIKKRYVRKKDLAEAPKRIEQVVLDMLNHYENKIAEPFKGMIVTVSRRAAVEYKKTMDKLNGPESAVVISSDHNDSEEFKKYALSDEQEERVKKRFKDPNDDLKFLIVCDKLLTGFDAPVAQVMYLDKHLEEHNLLQAIARVNRTYEDKNYGLVVDYYGIADELYEALHKFSRKDVQDVMVDLTDDEKVISKLEAAHRKSMSFFDGLDLDDTEECVEVLEDEEKRINFNRSFKEFSKMMDILLPEPEAKPYRSDLKKLGEIYEVSKKRYRDDSMNLAGCGEKVRDIIQEHVTSTGIEVLNDEPVSVMQEREFDDHVDELQSDKAKASEMKHALKKEINIRMDEDPVFYKSLQEKLEKLIEEYNQKRLTEKQAIKEYKKIVKRLRSREVEAQEKGLEGGTELAFFHNLDENLDLGKKELIQVTKDVKSIIEENTVVDWKSKVSVQRNLKKDTKIYLWGREDIDMGRDSMNNLVNDIIKIARNHY